MFPGFLIAMSVSARRSYYPVSYYGYCTAVSTFISDDKVAFRDVVGLKYRGCHKLNGGTQAFLRAMTKHDIIQSC